MAPDPRLESKLEKLRALVIQYSAYYQQVLDDDTVRMYAEDMLELDLAKVEQAFLTYRRNPKNRTMPMPAVIREIINPSVREEDVAEVMALRIMRAHSTHGQVWDHGYHVGGKLRFQSGQTFFDTFAEAANAELGEVGLAVIGQYGGWRRLATYLDETPQGTALPQLRRAVESIIKLAQAGVLNAIPRLPAQDRPLIELRTGTDATPQPARVALPKYLAGLRERSEK